MGGYFLFKERLIMVQYGCYIIKDSFFSDFPANRLDQLHDLVEGWLDVHLEIRMKHHSKFILFHIFVTPLVKADAAIPIC